MKKRMLAVMLPVAAFVALAGTGFGVWVFNETSNVSTHAGYSVTNAYSVGAIILAKGTAAGDDTITLDQNNPDFQLKYVTTSGVTEALGGSSAAGESQGDWTANAASDTFKVKANYKFEVVLGGGLEKYIAIKSIDRETNNAVTSGSAFDVTYASVTKNSVLTETYNIEFEWKPDMKPTTIAAYNTMVGDVDTGTITLTATLNSAVYEA
jgi:hypothetical protein